MRHGSPARRAGARPSRAGLLYRRHEVLRARADVSDAHRATSRSARSWPTSLATRKPPNGSNLSCRKPGSARVRQSMTLRVAAAVRRSETSACCADDEAAKLDGKAGCGCGPDLGRKRKRPLPAAAEAADSVIWGDRMQSAGEVRSLGCAALGGARMRGAGSGPDRRFLLARPSAAARAACGGSQTAAPGGSQRRSTARTCLPFQCWCRSPTATIPSASISLASVSRSLAMRCSGSSRMGSGRHYGVGH